MDESKFKELMDAIQASKQELQVDFSSQISKLQHDVTTSQESSSQEVVKKLNRRAYQFQKKGNEAQFNFNSSVDDHISAAKKELKKLTPTGEQDRAIVQNVTNHLDEGTKSIEVRQKHIRLADRSELGWAVVTAYENDELASDSDDEKRIYRAEREAERMQKGSVPVQPMQPGRGRQPPVEQIGCQCKQARVQQPTTKEYGLRRRNPE